LPPQDVCALYRAAGYDFMALTDHFLAAYGYPIVDTTAFRTDGFTTLIGAEAHAPATRQGELWHILAVGLPKDFTPTGVNETGPALARRARAAGAFIALAHPTWYGLDLDDVASIPEAHAIEIYNHRSQVRNDRGDATHLADSALAASRRINLIAVDDAHGRGEDSFGGFVMVKAARNDPDELLAALKAGAFYSSQGPQIELVAFDGDFVDIRCSPARSIIALGRASRAVQSVGDQLTDARLDLSQVRKGGYARIVVADAQGRRAWTNPVYFDDGAV
jgi:hypothetical protein